MASADPEVTLDDAEVDDEAELDDDIDDDDDDDPSSGSLDDESDSVLYGYEDPEHNLIKNWSFEQPITDDDWQVKRASVTRSQDSHTGEWSLHVYNRSHKHGHAFQRITDVKRRTSYYYSCFMKFLTHPKDQMYFHCRMFLNMKKRNEDQTRKFQIGRLTFQRAPTRWHQFGADFVTPDEPIRWIEVQLELDEDVDYLLDSVSCIELPTEKRWKKKAKKLIKKHRTSIVNISINLPPDVNPSEFVVKIRQVKREFAFGAGITADVFNDNNDFSHTYRNCFFQNFEWSVFNNDTKWKAMERKKGEIRYQRVDKALEKLHAKNVTVRGHAIHWNKQDSCPEWVKNLKGKELEDEIERRVKYVVEHFKGRLVQWDVCNEHLHNHFLEDRTGKTDILHRICRIANDIDPDCQLYLNDYQLIRTGDLTSAQANLARDLLAECVPIHGIGIQSHLRTLPIQMEIMKKRLEIVCSVGLPVMITEFSVHTNDVKQRAISLKEALYVYFSNPRVVGVIFWNFSDQKFITMGDDMALFEGPNFVPNKAGKTLMKLLKTWSTNKNIKPTERRSRKKIRAFHGKYEMRVIWNGSEVMGQSFEVRKGKSLNLDIDIELGDLCPDDGVGQVSLKE